MSPRASGWRAVWVPLATHPVKLTHRSHNSVCNVACVACAVGKTTALSEEEQLERELMMPSAPFSAPSAPTSVPQAREMTDEVSRGAVRAISPSTRVVRAIRCRVLFARSSFVADRLRWVLWCLRLESPEHGTPLSRSPRVRRMGGLLQGRAPHSWCSFMVWLPEGLSPPRVCAAASPILAGEGACGARGEYGDVKLRRVRGAALAHRSAQRRVCTRPASSSKATRRRVTRRPSR